MMGWFSNLFSPSSSKAGARRKVSLSTHDAFSLPTSSPITASHPDTFRRSGAFSPDFGASSSAQYSYPPSTSSPKPYDYLPRQNGRLPTMKSRPSSLLPFHSNTPLSPLPPYPSLEQTWARIRNWLSREYPELGDTLNYGILPQDLGEIEMALGTSLPAVVRESYLVVDGQEAESAAGCSEGLFFGLTFLPLEDVLEEWRFWREVDDDPATGANSRLKEVMQSIPPGWVRRSYSQRGWIPLITDKAGNYLGVDLSPDERGSVGQVIVFGRDFDTKVVIWRGEGPTGWARWLAAFAEDLENGEGFELGPGSDGSEGSEDSVGYESYFFDGSGRTKGEGGGDSGAGLRLTGEYRGWNVLEAWADKSMKKWQETGELPSPMAAPTPTTKAKVGLGVLDLSARAGPEVSAETADTTADEENSTTPTKALMNVSNKLANVRAGSLSNLPTISVTKPPAPRPVELPSPRDLRFSSSPPDSRSASFDQDLERGCQLSIDEVEHPLSTATVPVKSPSPANPTVMHIGNESTTVKEATLVPLPASGPESTSPLDPSRNVPDLLQQNDSTDGVQIAPIEPELSPVDRKLDVNALHVDITSSLEAAPEVPQDPDQTIRLIGGGGTSGLVSGPDGLENKDLEGDRADVVSISSVTSTDVDSTTGAPSKNHAKKRSITSGLKKIGKMRTGTVKRKADSKDSAGAL